MITRRDFIKTLVAIPAVVAMPVLANTNKPLFKDCYSDIAGHTNPVVMDSNGKYDPVLYKGKIETRAYA